MAASAQQVGIAAAVAGAVLLGGRLLMKPWTPPAKAEPFLADIAAAESANRLPQGLLARVLYQESRFRDDIIRGELQSSAGAQGIAQLVPRWHPGVDPLNPTAAIHHAGRYLRELQNEFGRWDHSLAAYNWGPGNVRAHLLGREGKRVLPNETRDYVREVLADVPEAAPDGRAIA